MNEELDFTKLKYVLYVRKSTDDPQRQVRSIPDQIAECLELAGRLHINVVNRNNPLIETKSAKKPNQRPIFSQMVKDIKKGIYDSILSWNPDRLSRNMREGGEIIDMVDEEIIKDLKFVTHHFSKDANGKMLLGMAFVLSKHYSDDLSQKVTRGVRSRLKEGKTPTPKHGYINEEGYYFSDDNNFKLICEAWKMRGIGNSLEEIADYMNERGYGRIIKKTGRRVKMTPQILSEIFKDPFYYGILIQAGQQVDLRQLYDFKPAITEEDYNVVQSLSYRRIKPSKPHRLAFYPLRMMVKCAFCSAYCRVGASSGETRRYLYYRCDNELCTRKKRSLRAKLIFDFIYQFLKDSFNFSENEYNQYYAGITKLTDERGQKLKIKLHSKHAGLKGIDREIKEIALKILDFEKGSTVRKVNESRLEELEKQ